MELFEKDSVYTLCANTASLLFFFHLVSHFECSAQFFGYFQLYGFIWGECVYMYFLSNSHESNICLLQLIMGVLDICSPLVCSLLLIWKMPQALSLSRFVWSESKLTSVIITITTELSFRTFCSCCGKHQEAGFRNQWLCLGRNGGPMSLSLEHNFISDHPFTWSEWVKLLSRCDTMDCSLQGSSVHGIFPARVLEWVAISFSRGSSWPRDGARVSCITGRRFTI